MNKPDQNSKPAFSGERVRLGDVCAKGKSSLRQKDLRNDGPYVVFGASGIAGTSASYQNESPYVAVVKDGAGVGRARICQEQSSVLGTMQALIPNERITCKYLLHLVRSMKLGEGFSGSTIPHIYFKDYSEREVVVPALDDQEKITSTLDKIENLIDGEKTTITHLQSLAKSRFVEMFGSKDFDHKPLIECVISIDSGKSPNCTSSPRANRDPAVLKLSAVSSGIYREGENKGLLPGETIVGSKEVVRGDILLARKNTPELVGRSVYVSRTEGNIMFPDIVFRMHPRPVVNGIYLAHVLSGPMFGEVKSLAHGSAKSMSNIPKSKLANLQIPLPPLPLQREFAAFAGRAAKLEFVAQQQIEKLQTLYDSLAQEYFG